MIKKSFELILKSENDGIVRKAKDDDFVISSFFKVELVRFLHTILLAGGV